MQITIEVAEHDVVLPAVGKTIQEVTLISPERAFKRHSLHTLLRYLALIGYDMLETVYLAFDEQVISTYNSNDLSEWASPRRVVVDILPVTRPVEEEIVDTSGDDSDTSDSD